MAKLSANRRALLLANLFNLLVAIYFIIIAIVSLIQLRWYHQLTVTVRLRHLVTSATSYFAFFLLIFVALLLMSIFVASILSSQKEQHQHQQQAKVFPVRSARQASDESSATEQPANVISSSSAHQPQPKAHFAAPNKLSRHTHKQQQHKHDRFRRHRSRTFEAQASSCCSSALHLSCALGLVLILVIWLVNTGELVRESIFSQLELAYAKYQFSNRSNHYSIAIDAMQDINNCCGSLVFTDFPRHRHTGLSSGHYPGSCCGKNIFGVNARVICTPEEIWRARQTEGCTHVLAHYYELVSLLVVPVALVCLFVNISIMALVSAARGGSIAAALGRQARPVQSGGRSHEQEHEHQFMQQPRAANQMGAQPETSHTTGQANH